LHAFSQIGFVLENQPLEENGNRDPSSHSGVIALVPTQRSRPLSDVVQE